MMKGFVGFFFCATCIALVVVSRANASENTVPSPLVYRMQCAETYSTSQPVKIGFTLENHTDEALWVLKWLTPLEGITGRIFIVTCGGQEVPYEGPLVSRIGPFKSDYVRIGPRASVSSQVDLSAAYKLPAGRECTVSFTGRLLDVRRGETLKLEKGDEVASMETPGNSVTFRLTSQN